MIWAAFNDLFQRFMTGNKLEQRRNLEKHVDRLGLPEGARVLDFGCGTGLFAETFIGRGMRYVGYDICPNLTGYAARLHGRARFTTSKRIVAESGPYDLIVANCCFHHIDTKIIQEELGTLGGLLAEDGKFLLIDILLAPNETFFLRRWFRRLERGAFVRSEAEYRAVVESRLRVTASSVARSHLFSIPGIPVYNDQAIIVAERRD